MKMFMFEKTFGASEVAKELLRKYPDIRLSKEYKKQLRYIGLIMGGCTGAAERMEWLQTWMVEAITTSANLSKTDSRWYYDIDEDSREDLRYTAAVQFLTAYDSI